MKELLGGGKDKKKATSKVAVVIDPRLSKVLRPHQVEGVKVSLSQHHLSTSLIVIPVPVQMYDRNDGRQPIWLHYG